MIIKIVVAAAIAALVALDPGGGFAGVAAIAGMIKTCASNSHEWCNSSFPYIPPKLAVAMGLDRLVPTAEKVAKKVFGENNHAMKEKVVIVTGASSGLGYQATQTMLNRGATVILACRNVKKGEKALKEMMEAGATGKGLVMELELSDLDSVESFAKAFIALDLPLHVLLNNAALMMPGYGVQQYGKQGYELQFSVNHLSHFHLTSLLEDKLLSTGTKTEPARAVYITTSGIEFWRGSDDDGHMSRQVPAFQHDNYHSFFGYINSKGLNVITSREQQRLWKDKGTAISFSVNPGLVGGYFSGCAADTPTMLDEAGSIRGAFYSWPFAHAAKTPQQGGASLVHAAIQPEVVEEVIKGAFYYNNNKVTTAGALSGHPEYFTNDAVNQEAWKRTEALLVDRPASKKKEVEA